MLATAFNRTWAQLLHPKFRTVFMMGAFAAAATLAILIYCLYEFWPEGYSTGWEWLDTGGFTFIATIATYILFPPIATSVMSLMADQVADAVEEEYYPHRIGRRKVSIGDILISAIKLTLLIIILNLLALIPYIFLLVATAGAGALALFLMVNGYLLGREYFEMVAMRHLPRKELHRMRKQHSGKIFVTGFIIAGMFLIPVVNLLAPIVGAALMTHRFQFLIDEFGPNLNQRTV